MQMCVYIYHFIDIIITYINLFYGDQESGNQLIFVLTKQRAVFQ